MSRTIPTPVELGDFVATMVHQFVSQDKPFTVYDITRQLREDNPTVEFTRQDVKILVNYLYNIGKLNNYVRTSTILQTGDSAFVFHNANVSSDTHPFAEKRNDAPSSTDPDDDENLEDMIEITKESRLNIPQKLLKNLGMNVGDEVYLVLDDNITPAILTKDTVTDISMKVNADGAVRISQTNLVKKFKKVSQFYKVYQGLGCNGICIESV
jgi:hypothetical protein